MSKLEELLEQIAKRRIFVINLFQTQQKFPDIRQKTWRCNLMEESTNNIFEVGTGATIEEALEKAIEKSQNYTPRTNNIPTFLTKATVNVKEAPPETAMSIEDML